MLPEKDIKNTLSKFRDELNIELAKFFDVYYSKNKYLPNHNRHAIKILKEYILRGGKRYRAALMYFTYLYTGGKSKKAILNASMFMEFLQAYALIHDDIIDQSELRRGKPTLHKIYEKIHEYQYEKQDPVHFGEAMGINLGDICAHIGFNILTDSKFPIKNKLEAIKVAHELSQILYQGQLLDIVSEVEPAVTIEEVNNIQKYKTAVYSFKLPMYLGAVLAGHHPSKLNALDKYSINCGIAYQIQDDILGLFGEEEVTGKSSTSDVREGKQTLLIIKALEKSTEEETALIERSLGNSNLKMSTFNKIRQIVKDTGSLEYSEHLSYDLVTDAQKAVKNSSLFDSEGKDFMIEFAGMLVGRKF